MKKSGIIVIAVLAVAIVCGGFFYVTQANKTEKTDEKELTEVEKLITKNLDADYPQTPREVVKLYNRIITAYYEEDFEDDQLSQLTTKARTLFDDELAANNPEDEYYSAVQSEIEEYHSDEKIISSSTVCDSNDVQYIEDNGDSIAYVTSSYFVKTGSDYSRTYEMYVLRKDAQDHWKILVYYQLDGTSTEE